MVQKVNLLQPFLKPYSAGCYMIKGTLKQGVKYVLVLLTLKIFHTLFQCFYC